MDFPVTFGFDLSDFEGHQGSQLIFLLPEGLADQANDQNFIADAEEPGAKQHGPYRARRGYSRSRLRLQLCRDSPEPPGTEGGGETEDWRGGTKPPEPAVPAIARGDRLDERQVESKRIVTDFTERSILPPPKKGRIDDFSYSPPAAN